MMSPYAEGQLLGSLLGWPFDHDGRLAVAAADSMSVLQSARGRGRGRAAVSCIYPIYQKHKSLPQRPQKF